MHELLLNVVFPLLLLSQHVGVHGFAVIDSLALLQERAPPRFFPQALPSHAALLDDLTSEGGDLSVRFGCTDPFATNFDASATANDGSCFIKAPPQKWHFWRMHAPKYVYSDDQRMHPADVLVMYQMADLLGKLFDEKEIVWWAADGSLLGAIRNKGIIPHDDDVDYNILEDQVNIVKSTEFQTRLEANGLKLVVPDSPHLADRLYVWNYSFYNSTNASTNGHGTKMKLDLWPLRRSETAWAGLCDEEPSIRQAYVEARKDIGAPRRFPRDLCVTTEEYEEMVANYPDAMKQSESLHIGEWYCALRAWPFGDTQVNAPSTRVSEAYLSARYKEWKTQTACQGTLHHCITVTNTSWDVTGHAEPSEPLLELK